jgi:hypothetical protein
MTQIAEHAFRPQHVISSPIEVISRAPAMPRRMIANAVRERRMLGNKCTAPGELSEISSRMTGIDDQHHAASRNAIGHRCIECPVSSQSTTPLRSRVELQTFSYAEVKHPRAALALPDRRQVVNATLSGVVHSLSSRLKARRRKTTVRLLW